MMRLQRSSVAGESWLFTSVTASARRCFSFTSSSNPTISPASALGGNSNNDNKNIMSNVIQGPSLLITSLHRPEPTLMMVPGLRSLPFWTSNGRVAYDDPQVSKIVQHLQQNADAIRNEYQTVAPTIASDYDVTSTTTSSTKTKTKSSGTEHSNKNGTSLHTGSWDWHSYMLHGQVQSQFCERFPITTQAIQAIGPDLFTHTPFGFCFFSNLAAQSTIQAHTSPINFRLRIHLPLIVPKTTNSSHQEKQTKNADDTIGICVGPVTQSWIEDQAIVLDDSYNHEVWNKTQEERVVLLVDIWHPDVRPQEREEIVRMFHHAKHQGWLKSN